MSQFPVYLGIWDHIKYAGIFLKPAISIEFNNVDSNNLAGYKERTHVLYMILILSKQVCSLKQAISIEFNDVDSNNLAGYKERTRILYMIQLFLVEES